MGKEGVLENTWSLSFEVDSRSGGGDHSINIFGCGAGHGAGNYMHQRWSLSLALPWQLSVAILFLLHTNSFIFFGFVGMLIQSPPQNFLLADLNMCIWLNWRVLEDRGHTLIEFHCQVVSSAKKMLKVDYIPALKILTTYLGRLVRNLITNSNHC